jgi:hypothetical protein
MLDTQHFRGTKVIASTAKRVWERLLIPVGCVVRLAPCFSIIVTYVHLCVDPALFLVCRCHHHRCHLLRDRARHCVLHWARVLVVEQRHFDAVASGRATRPQTRADTGPTPHHHHGYDSLHVAFVHHVSNALSVWCSQSSLIDRYCGSCPLQIDVGGVRRPGASHVVRQSVRHYRHRDCDHLLRYARVIGRHAILHAVRKVPGEDCRQAGMCPCIMVSAWESSDTNNLD